MLVMSNLQQHYMIRKLANKSLMPMIEALGIKRKNFDDKALPLCYNQLKALYFCKRHHMTVFLQVHTTLKRADHFALFYKGHGSFRCFNYQSTAGKLKCRMQTEYRKAGCGDFAGFYISIQYFHLISNFPAHTRRGG